jgi:hypothetical protein
MTGDRDRETIILIVVLVNLNSITKTLLALAGDYSLTQVQG